MAVIWQYLKLMISACWDCLHRHKQPAQEVKRPVDLLVCPKCKSHLLKSDPIPRFWVTLHVCQECGYHWLVQDEVLTYVLAPPHSIIKKSIVIYPERLESIADLSGVLEEGHKIVMQTTDMEELFTPEEILQRLRNNPFAQSAELTNFCCQQWEPLIRIACEEIDDYGD